LKLTFTQSFLKSHYPWPLSSTRKYVIRVLELSAVGVLNLVLPTSGKTVLDKMSFLSVSSSYKVRVQRNPLPLSTEYIANAALQRILPSGLRRKLGGGRCSINGYRWSKGFSFFCPLHTIRHGCIMAMCFCLYQHICEVLIVVFFMWYGCLGCLYDVFCIIKYKPSKRSQKQK
jgi:hypothetical protein